LLVVRGGNEADAGGDARMPALENIGESWHEGRTHSLLLPGMNHRRISEAGIIPVEKRERWDGLRDLRNETTHISIRHLTSPHEALRVLELPAGEVDALFAAPRPNAAS
jgi:hypothetical protein